MPAQNDRTRNVKGPVSLALAMHPHGEIYTRRQEGELISIVTHPFCFIKNFLLNQMYWERGGGCVFLARPPVVSNALLGAWHARRVDGITRRIDHFHRQACGWLSKLKGLTALTRHLTGFLGAGEGGGFVPGLRPRPAWRERWHAVNQAGGRVASCAGSAT